MEVEIEDLHLQIDDIAKAKTAVRMRGVPGQTRGSEGEWSCDSGCFYPKQGSFPSPVPSRQDFLRREQASPPLPLPTQSRGLGGGEVEEGASKGPSPCLTTCLWELGHWPQHHKYRQLMWLRDVNRYLEISRSTDKKMGWLRFPPMPLASLLTSPSGS